ncbi:predicted protein, partial [Haematococcus lacustris]
MAEAHCLPTKRLILLPRSLTKTVHFIRHGEAFSNVAGHADHAQYMSEAWFDASLSPHGWQQSPGAARAGNSIEARAGGCVTPDASPADSFCCVRCWPCHQRGR